MENTRQLSNDSNISKSTVLNRNINCPNHPEKKCSCCNTCENDRRNFSIIKTREGSTQSGSKGELICEDVQTKFEETHLCLEECDEDLKKCSHISEDYVGYSEYRHTCAIVDFDSDETPTSTQQPCTSHIPVRTAMKYHCPFHDTTKTFPNIYECSRDAPQFMYCRERNSVIQSQPIDRKYDFRDNYRSKNFTARSIYKHKPKKSSTLIYTKTTTTPGPNNTSHTITSTTKIISSSIPLSSVGQKTSSIVQPSKVKEIQPKTDVISSIIPLNSVAKKTSSILQLSEVNEIKPKTDIQSSGINQITVIISTESNNNNDIEKPTSKTEVIIKSPSNSKAYITNISEKTVDKYVTKTPNISEFLTYSGLEQENSESKRDEHNVLTKKIVSSTRLPQVYERTPEKKETQELKTSALTRSSVPENNLRKRRTISQPPAPSWSSKNTALSKSKKSSQDGSASSSKKSNKVLIVPNKYSRTSSVLRNVKTSQKSSTSVRLSESKRPSFKKNSIVDPSSHRESGIKRVSNKASTKSDSDNKSSSIKSITQVVSSTIILPPFKRTNDDQSSTPKIITGVESPGEKINDPQISPAMKSVSSSTESRESKYSQTHFDSSPTVGIQNQNLSKTLYAVEPEKTENTVMASTNDKTNSQYIQESQKSTLNNDKWSQTPIISTLGYTDASSQTVETANSNKTSTAKLIDQSTAKMQTQVLPSKTSTQTQTSEYLIAKKYPDLRTVATSTVPSRSRSELSMTLLSPKRTLSNEYLSTDTIRTPQSKLTIQTNEIFHVKSGGNSVKSLPIEYSQRIFDSSPTAATQKSESSVDNYNAAQLSSPIFQITEKSGQTTQDVISPKSPLSIEKWTETPFISYLERIDNSSQTEPAVTASSLKPSMAKVNDQSGAEMQSQVHTVDKIEMTSTHDNTISQNIGTNEPERIDTSSQTEPANSIETSTTKVIDQSIVEKQSQVSQSQSAQLPSSVTEKTEMTSNSEYTNFRDLEKNQTSDSTNDKLTQTSIISNVERMDASSQTDQVEEVIGIAKPIDQPSAEMQWQIPPSQSSTQTQTTDFILPKEDIDERRSFASSPIVVVSPRARSRSSVISLVYASKISPRSSRKGSTVSSKKSYKVTTNKVSRVSLEKSVKNSQLLNVLQQELENMSLKSDKSTNTDQELSQKDTPIIGISRATQTMPENINNELTPYPLTYPPITIPEDFINKTQEFKCCDGKCCKCPTLHDILLKLSELIATPVQFPNNFSIPCRSIAVQTSRQFVDSQTSKSIDKISANQI